MSTDIPSLQATAMYNLNRRVIEVCNKNTLLNRKVFIIGGGESLRNINLSRLDNEITIGVNRAFELCNVKYTYLMDNDFYQNVTNDKYGTKDKFTNSPMIKICLAIPARIIYTHNCFVVNRSYKEVISKDIATGIYTGNQSGLGAIFLAISMGCKDIYLLGFDMQAKKYTHNHDGYNYDLKECNERCSRFKEEIDYWAPKFQKDGINITQLIIEKEQETALNCFNKQYFRHVVHG